MAPECAGGEEVDHRSDLYSLGCVGYYLLTGTNVFEGTNIIDILAKHRNEQPVAPSKRLQTATIPAAIDAVIVKCLAKAPGDRFENAAAMLQTLEAIPGLNAWTGDVAEKWWNEAESRLGVKKVEISDAETGSLDGSSQPTVVRDGT